MCCCLLVVVVVVEAFLSAADTLWGMEGGRVFGVGGWVPENPPPPPMWGYAMSG